MSLNQAKQWYEFSLLQTAAESYLHLLNPADPGSKNRAQSPGSGLSRRGQVLQSSTSPQIF
jgi:hypothetical protein